MINSYNFAGWDIFIFIYICVHSSPYLFVCGDDRVILLSGSRWCFRWARRCLMAERRSRVQGILWIL